MKLWFPFPLLSPPAITVRRSWQFHKHSNDSAGRFQWIIVANLEKHSNKHYFPETNINLEQGIIKLRETITKDINCIFGRAFWIKLLPASLYGKYIDQTHYRDRNLFLLAICTVGNFSINIIYTQTLGSLMALVKWDILLYVFMEIFRQLRWSYLLTHTHTCRQVRLSKTKDQREEAVTMDSKPWVWVFVSIFRLLDGLPAECSSFFNGLCRTWKAFPNLLLVPSTWSSAACWAIWGAFSRHQWALDQATNIERFILCPWGLCKRNDGTTTSQLGSSNTEWLKGSTTVE